MQGFIYVHFSIEITFLLVENNCQIVECLIELGIQLRCPLVVVDSLIDYSNIEIGICNDLVHLGIFRLTQLFLYALDGLRVPA